VNNFKVRYLNLAACGYLAGPPMQPGSARDGPRGWDMQRDTAHTTYSSDYAGVSIVGWNVSLNDGLVDPGGAFCPTLVGLAHIRG